MRVPALKEQKRENPPQSGFIGMHAPGDWENRGTPRHSLLDTVSVLCMCWWLNAREKWKCPLKNDSLPITAPSITKSYPMFPAVDDQKVETAPICHLHKRECLHCARLLNPS